MKQYHVHTLVLPLSRNVSCTSTHQGTTSVPGSTIIEWKTEEVVRDARFSPIFALICRYHGNTLSVTSRKMCLAHLGLQGKRSGARSSWDIASQTEEVVRHARLSDRPTARPDWQPTARPTTRQIPIYPPYTLRVCGGIINQRQGATWRIFITTCSFWHLIFYYYRTTLAGEINSHWGPKRYWVLFFVHWREIESRMRKMHLWLGRFGQPLTGYLGLMLAWIWTFTCPSKSGRLPSRY